MMLIDVWATRWHVCVPLAVAVLLIDVRQLAQAVRTELLTSSSTIHNDASVKPVVDFAEDIRDATLRWNFEDFLAERVGLQNPADPEIDVQASTSSRHIDVKDVHERTADQLSNRLPFNVTQALLLARLQTTIYCNLTFVEDWSCTRCNGSVASFKPLDVIFDADWDLSAMVGFWDAFDAIFVVFRGTDSHNLGNWIANIEVLTQPYYSLPFPGYEDARVHRGFFNCLNSSSLAGNISDAIVRARRAHGDVPVYFLGHSLGGAMASIAAPHLKALHGLPDVRLWTFGSPRTGNLMFTTLIEEFMSESVRLTHGHDIVPSLPIALFGYHHVPREVWQEPDVDGGGGRMRLRRCDGSGEDPTCHSSVCRFGICTSIADHVLYLGMHMYHADDEC